MKLDMKKELRYVKTINNNNVFERIDMTNFSFYHKSYKRCTFSITTINKQRLTYCAFTASKFINTVFNINEIINCNMQNCIFKSINFDSTRMLYSTTFDKINLEDLVKNMRIYNNNFYLNQHGLVYAEQIILNRYWMYKRIYWNEPNRANMCLMKNIVYYAVAQGKNSANKILDAILSCTYKDFLTMLHEIRIKDKSLSDIYGHNIDFIKNKGNKRYKNILFFGKSSSMYPECNETYDKFNQKNYAQQEQIRLKIEKKIIEKYNVNDSIIKSNGSLVLIDCPIGGEKVGEDIEILKHDGSIQRLSELSGAVKGAGEAFREDLKLIRVFAHPSLYQLLESNLSDVGKNVYEFLREEL